ncbi:helix-turn-helix domain-containing protein [Enterococcus sp. BWR-S5]|uniref:helix-turn-helix domain-containing protein n=1 Tax=Enterococcus sp. BWR-S5 TaxID=2787714 RepID=UPI001F424288|nr:helix-turn-helix domain-containing protein [Enterococcus sp. BWR-S5]
MNIATKNGGSTVIESFIEKDVLRQVKLIEYLYELEKLTLREVAKRLQVTTNTVKRDFDKVVFLLEEQIEHSELTSTTISIIFNSSFTRYDLAKIIYQDSYFLKTCAYYLLGESDYLTIVEAEFISVAKAFTIKKQVESYFRAAGIMDEKSAFIPNEIRYRLVLISVWMRCDLLDKLIAPSQYKTATVFVDQVLFKFANGYEKNNREYQFLLLNTYLSLSRFKEFSLIYEKDEITYLKNTPTFHQLMDVNELILAKEKLPEAEIQYLASIYKTIPLNTSNYLIVEMNYQRERELMIERNAMVRQLIKSFENEFGVDLFDHILFEKPFMNFIYSLWQETQAFSAEKHFYLSDQQLHLAERIKHVLEAWQKQFDLDAAFTFNQTTLEKFCSQVTASLIQKRAQKFVFFFIAEDELSHTIYRENLKRWLNLDYNVIDSTMYYSLDDLPIYVKEWPSIIICERSLKHDFTIPDTLSFFPISRNSILEDTKNILSSVYHWKSE